MDIKSSQCGKTSSGYEHKRMTADKKKNSQITHKNKVRKNEDFTSIQYVLGKKHDHLPKMSISKGNKASMRHEGKTYMRTE